MVNSCLREDKCILGKLNVSFFPIFANICKSSKGSYLMNCGLDNFISNFKNLYERGLAFAKAFVFDANLAEDITSESLIVLWNKLREGQHIEQPQIYLFARVEVTKRV